VAKLVERSVDAILKIERGVSLSGLDTLIRLAEPLGVTVADLLEPLWQEGIRDPARAELELALLQLARSLGRPEPSHRRRSGACTGRLLARLRGFAEENADFGPVA
jgi:transcriptional regulator with XRE-family HTH domain